MVKPIPWLVPDPPPRPRLRVEMQTVRQPGEPEQGEVMTDDEIIALAVAHLGKIEMTRQDGEELVISTRSLDLVTAMLAFARALIAAEQESVKKWQGLADASATLLSVVQARHKREIDAEREACAAACDAVANRNSEQYWPDASISANECADAIRARGK